VTQTRVLKRFALMTCGRDTNVVTGTELSLRVTLDGLALDIAWDQRRSLLCRVLAFAIKFLINLRQPLSEIEVVRASL
jgi:hypothetical protein